MIIFIIALLAALSLVVASWIMATKLDTKYKPLLIPHAIVCLSKTGRLEVWTPDEATGWKIQYDDRTFAYSYTGPLVNKREVLDDL